MEEVEIPNYIAWRRIGNQLIILNLKDRRFHIIEGGGKDIFEVIEKQTDEISRMVCVLVKKYGEKWRDTIEKDVKEFIEKCLKVGILTTKGRR